MFTDYNQRGFSLIELIMFIVIVSIALTGIMLVMNKTVGHSADTLLRKQALTVAESLLEEIEAQAVSGVTSCSNTPVVSSKRVFPYKICDYNNFVTSGVFDLSGAAVSGLDSYNVAVSVTSHVLGNIPQGSAVQVTVTVTPPLGPVVAVTGYRTEY